MLDESQQFIESLLSSYSPSGFEKDGQVKWKNRTVKYVDKIEVDVHGNVIASINLTAQTRVMLAGHGDEIGFMVTQITDEGFIKFAAIGGIDPAVLPGIQIVLLGKKRIFGVIGKKPIHLTARDDRGKPVEIKNLWIDIGARSKKEVEKFIQIGTAGCVAANFRKLLNNNFTSKSWDDRAGSFIVSEVMRLLSARRKQLKVAVYGVSTVQEEIGLRGAQTASFGIDPHVGFAIDVGFATDCPGDDKSVVGDVSMGKGPILHRGANFNDQLLKRLETAADKSKTAVQWSAEPRGSSTDAEIIQITRAGVATALVSIPTRYMHTAVEICNLKDVENAAKIIADTILAMPANPQFIPY